MMIIAAEHLPGILGILEHNLRHATSSRWYGLQEPIEASKLVEKWMFRAYPIKA
jgi:hypothetical protein